MTPHEARELLEHIRPDDNAPITAGDLRALLAHMADQDAALLRVLNQRCHWAELTHPDQTVERILVPGCPPALNGAPRCDCDSLTNQLAEAKAKNRRKP